MYDAFVSYSHARDKPIAAALQAVLQALGKPWYRRRALRVFRDDTSLSASPHLWASIEKSLAASRYLVLLASEEAAASPWVSKEVEYWLAKKSRDTLLIALTSGDLKWGRDRNDFVSSAASPLPPVLHGRFEAEPKWVDLRHYRENPSEAQRRNPEFARLAADIAAAVHGMPKEDLLSEELINQRRALRLAWSTAAVLVVLAGVALGQWQLTVRAEQRALHTLAASDQQKAVELFSRSGEKASDGEMPGRALAYLARAIRNDPSDHAIGRRALYLMAEHPLLYPGSMESGVALVEPRTMLIEEGSGDATAPKILKSPDGGWELSLGSPLKVRRLDDPEWRDVKEQVEFALEHTAASFPNHGRYAAAAGGLWTEFGGYAEFKLIDDGGGVIARHVFDGEKVSGVTFSPDGRLLFVSLFSPRTGGGGSGRDKERTVLFSIDQTKNMNARIAELRTFDGPMKTIRFSADSRLAVLGGRAQTVGPVVENEPLPTQKSARAVYFSADGSRVIASGDDHDARAPLWQLYDSKTGAPLAGSGEAGLPPEADRSAEVKAEALPDGIVVTVAGKPSFKVSDPHILLAGVNRSGDRLIFIRDDGSAEDAPVAAATLSGAKLPLALIYGNPWHEWTDDFVTVASGTAQWWKRIYRKEGLDLVAWRKALKGVVRDVADDSTRVVLHPSGKMVAVGSMGHSRAEARLVDVATGAPLSDTIEVADQYVEFFFSHDGNTLYLHSFSSGSAIGGFEMREVGGGLPLTRSRLHAGPFAESPDGKRMLDWGGGGDGKAGLFDLLGGGAPVPLWVADLAEGLSGLRLDDKSVVLRLSEEEQSTRIDGVRKALAAEKANSWSEFGRWYLSADPDPVISPYSALRRSAFSSTKSNEGQAGAAADMSGPQAPEGSAIDGRGGAAPPVTQTQDIPRVTGGETGDPPPAAIGAPQPQIAGPYFVQVGAYGDRAEAERQLSLLGSRFGELVRNRPAAILTLQTGGTNLYRARFTGFAQSEARAVCAQLQQAGIDCFVAGPN